MGFTNILGSNDPTFIYLSLFHLAPPIKRTFLLLQPWDKQPAAGELKFCGRRADEECDLRPASTVNFWIGFLNFTSFHADRSYKLMLQTRKRTCTVYLMTEIGKRVPAITLISGKKSCIGQTLMQHNVLHQYSL